MAGTIVTKPFDSKFNIVIRSSWTEALYLLPAIERSAAQLYSQVPAAAFIASSGPHTVDELRVHHDAGLLWIACIEDESEDKSKISTTIDEPRINDRSTKQLSNTLLPIGFLAATRIPPDYLHIDEISVSRDYQGQGAGRKLFQQVSRVIADWDSVAISCTTSSLLPWSFPWYRWMGFEVVLDFEGLRSLGPEEGSGLERRLKNRRENGPGRDLNDDKEVIPWALVDILRQETRLWDNEFGRSRVLMVKRIWLV